MSVYVHTGKWFESCCKFYSVFDKGRLFNLKVQIGTGLRYNGENRIILTVSKHDAFQ